MSGALRKIGVYLGLVEDSGRYDDEYDDYDEYDDDVDGRRAQPGARGQPPRAARVPRPATVAHSTSAVVAARRAGPGVAELARITTLHPRTYNEARTIGETSATARPSS